MNSLLLFIIASDAGGQGPTNVIRRRSCKDALTKKEWFLEMSRFYNKLSSLRFISSGVFCGFFFTDTQLEDIIDVGYKFLFVSYYFYFFRYPKFLSFTFLK